MISREHTLQCIQQDDEDSDNDSCPETSTPTRTQLRKHLPNIVRLAVKYRVEDKDGKDRQMNMAPHWSPNATSPQKCRNFRRTWSASLINRGLTGCHLPQMGDVIMIGFIHNHSQIKTLILSMIPRNAPMTSVVA